MRGLSSAKREAPGFWDSEPYHCKGWHHPNLQTHKALKYRRQNTGADQPQEAATSMEKTSTRGSQSAGAAALYSTYLLMFFTTFGYRYPQVTHWFLWGSLQAWHYCLHTWEQLLRLYSRALSYKTSSCLHKLALRKSKPRSLNLKHLAQQSGQKQQLPLHNSPQNLSTVEYSQNSQTFCFNAC